MYHKLSKWLNCLLKQTIPDEVTAFCLNLHDDGNGKWSMELIGTGRFDLDDPDWPCDEVTDFNTSENPFVWSGSSNWDDVLSEMVGVMREYLRAGKYAALLKSRRGVGIGFVDGDIEILFHK